MDGSHDKGFVAIAATHGVGSGSVGFMAFARIGAAATFVRVSDIPTVRPAIILIVVVTGFASGTAVVVVVVISVIVVVVFFVVVSCSELGTEVL